MASMRTASGTLFACRAKSQSWKRVATDGPALERLEYRQLLTVGPTAQEQQSLELLNRMRMDPADELPLLLNTPDKNVQTGITVFDVKKQVLTDQWADLQPAAPLAWNDL